MLNDDLAKRVEMIKEQGKVKEKTCNDDRSR
jgi:hypothetical protein